MARNQISHRFIASKFSFIFTLSFHVKNLFFLLFQSCHIFPIPQIERAPDHALFNRSFGSANAPMTPSLSPRAVKLCGASAALPLLLAVCLGIDGLCFIFTCILSFVIG